MLESLIKFNQILNSVVWGWPMLALLIGTGFYFSICTRWFQVFHIKIWLKGTFGVMLSKPAKTNKGGITPFQAAATALASTVGTGNIVGVATAIVAGGPGAVFWMWVSAFFGMMTKYAEIVLAVLFRERDEKGMYHGGPMYYIDKGLGSNFKWLSVLFCIFSILACLGIGNMNQSNSLAGAVEAGTGIPKLYTGIVIAIISGLVIIRGIKQIASVTEKLVPFMACFYIIGGLIAIFLDWRELPATFSVIFGQAFSLKSVGGGVMGYTIMRALRFGFARGVFSNEAGLGSAPIAHAAAETNNPVKQGLWGIFEVFVDTIVICTITALVIINSGLYENGLDGAALTNAAFTQYFGPIGGVFLSIGTVLFAVATILGWSYYGEQFIAYLFKNCSLILVIYRLVYIVFIVVGSVGGLKLIWDISDTLNGLMAIPNLIAIISLSDIVFKITRRYLKDPHSTDLNRFKIEEL